MRLILEVLYIYSQVSIPLGHPVCLSTMPVALSLSPGVLFSGAKSGVRGEKDFAAIKNLYPCHAKMSPITRQIGPSVGGLIPFPIGFDDLIFVAICSGRRHSGPAKLLVTDGNK